MAAATITRCWQDDASVYLAVVVVEDGGRNVHYVGRVALAALAGLTVAEQKAALVAAVKAERDARLAAVPTTIGAISGGVVV